MKTFQLISVLILAAFDLQGQTVSSSVQTFNFNTATKYLLAFKGTELFPTLGDLYDLEYFYESPKNLEQTFDIKEQEYFNVDATLSLDLLNKKLVIYMKYNWRFRIM